MAECKPVILLILDGWGHREQREYNAIAQAKTPVWDELLATCPHTLLSGSGRDVGLPPHQMGNSEVGHLCLGAGRVIYQGLERVNHAIEDGRLFEHAVLQKAFKHAKTTGNKVHLLGLLSPGGVHAHHNHMLAMLNMAKRHDIHDVYVHAFLDGRDTPPKSAHASLDLINQWFDAYGHGKIASLIGRFYAMDRDRRYDRTEKAYQCLTQALASQHAPDAIAGLFAAYEKDQTDEFVEPTILGEPIVIDDEDVVIFMNFRADRARQLSHALVSPDFAGFSRTKEVQLGQFVTLTDYDAKLDAQVVFLPEPIPLGLGEVIQNQKLTQLRLAETEKYAHVTFFFNGTREEPFVGEDRILIPSPKVTTYDLKPQMSAYEITQALTGAIREQKHDLIICNYANADMVGHTGKMDAAITAVETLDHCLGQIIACLQSHQGQMFITADHGNVEMMHNILTNQAHTAHTTECVPFVYVGPRKLQFNEPGGLADVAPTILKLMDIPIPKEMTGSVLFS